MDSIRTAGLTTDVGDLRAINEIDRDLHRGCDRYPETTDEPRTGGGVLKPAYTWYLTTGSYNNQLMKE